MPDSIAATSAGQLRGVTEDGVHVFKGVPYGAPAGGPNRFKPPQPREPWAGVRDALAFGDRCPQNDFAGLMEEEAIAVGTEPMSEDCLSLNVWTPALDDGRRPVMVWLHGGMYVSGSASGLRYDGSNLARRQDVVVVTVNHRLNVFGFLHLADLLGPEFADSGNVGMLDCVAALQWVRDNIAGFGGDPGNVTIFGESGGAGKVSTLMAMPAAKGLFHRAIAQSGTALRQAEAGAASGLAASLLEKLGLTRDRARALLDLPVERLLEGLGGLGMAGVFGLIPVVDGRALPSHPFDPTGPEISAEVPLIIGTNETEATFFATCPLDPIDEATLKAATAQFTRLGEAEVERLVAAYRAEHPAKDEVYLFQLIASDWWLTSAATLQAERKAGQGAAPVYLYYFTKHSPARSGRLKATHTLEIPFVFDTLHLAEPLTGPITPEIQGLADAMSGAWARFARVGDPNGAGLPVWPAYDPEGGRSVMVLGDRCEAVNDPYPQLRTLVAELRAAAGQA